MSEAAPNCVFCKIVARKEPAEVLYEDDFTIVLAAGGIGGLGVVAGGAGCGAVEGERGRFSSRRRNNPSLCSILVLLSGSEKLKRKLGSRLYARECYAINQ